MHKIKLTKAEIVQLIVFLGSNHGSVDYVVEWCHVCVALHHPVPP